MSGVAEYGRGACAGEPSIVAKVGTSGMGRMVDTARGAEAVAAEWADAAYETEDDDPQLDVGEPEAFEAHGLEGHVVAIDVVPAPHPCAPERAHVRVASVEMPSRDDVYNLILYGATSGDEGLDVKTVDTIFSSLREQPR